MAEAVRRQLLDAILYGDLAAPRRLYPAELARRLGVSITPVREALAPAVANEVIGPALQRAELQEPSAMLADLKAYLIALGHGARPAMEALSGVDIAIWDLLAQRAGQPLATLLGASPGPVATYASPVGFQASMAEAAAAARTLLAAGFRALKIKGRA